MTKGKKLVRVFEHEKLYLDGYRNGLLTIPQFDALVQYNQKYDSRFFTVIHKGIKFKQYVGVIQVGSLTIEVLPKADRENASEENKALWHSVLFQMLKVCKLIRLEGSSEANLRLRHASLLDLYINLFLYEVEQIIHHGLIKKYNALEENRKALSGQLKFQKHIVQNLVHKERFFVKHQVYDQNHLLHQFLYEALLIIPNVATNTNYSDRIGRMLLSFPSMPRKKVNPPLFENISYNRKTEHYRKAIELARLLLLNYSPDIQTGNNNVLAILFDMNELFEEYVFRMLKRETKTKPRVLVKRQQRRRFWEYKLVKPDIIIESDNKTIVIDTKWKVLREAKPSDADLKQMYVYHHYWGAEYTLLLYPNVYDLNRKSGVFHRPSDKEFQCQLGFVDILKDNVLNAGIGYEIFELVNL